MFRKLAVLAAAAALLVTARPAPALQDTGILSVQAVVASYCMIPDATLSFGIYDPAVAGDNNQSATVNVQCTPGTSFRMAMSAPAGAQRVMTFGANTLTYVLYANSADPATPWPTTIAVAPSFGPAVGPGMGTIPVTVYGRIPATQAVPAGNYVDTVTMTIDF